MTRASGKVYLVGAGPGDPDLLTRRALKVLARADVVLHDRLIASETLQLIAPQAKLVYVGKKASFHTLPQDDIEQQLVQYARLGKTVVRLKGGDPYIFGRGGEEAECLADAGIDFEVVPGISSALAAPLLAGIPLTHRRYTPSIAIVTGHENTDKPDEIPYQHGRERSASAWVDWEALAKMGTIVFLMGVGNVRANMQKLIEHGKSPDTPAAVIRWASLGRQRTVRATIATLADDIAEQKITAPSVIVIGGVAELSDKLGFFEKRALAGKRIIITRDAAGNAELSEKLRELAADVIDWPTFTYQAKPLTPTLTRELRHISRYDWIFFTSPRGVIFFMRHFLRVHQDVRALAGVKIAVVGAATREALRTYGLEPDLVPRTQTSAGLAKSPVFKRGRALKIFMVQPKDGRREFQNRWGHRHKIFDAVVYRKRDVPPEARTFERVMKKGADWILFFSPSAVASFLRHFPGGQGQEFLKKTRVAVIGKTTAQALREEGVDAVTVAVRPSVEKLLEAISVKLG